MLIGTTDLLREKNTAKEAKTTQAEQSLSQHPQ
jgi:hypothetical protein